ncbi:hypothetical protein BO70DRAFT_112585 [Aspergillus heteromorphus CBS 117.55]|uniref:Uncharacterized protein n=1 Tax=Aspergillus heteromorphus CBS 117.55 TaxID=1448321 RepID=A0A317VJ76_9EURO|nr:uncharacterized protein BO70DRAFT_112585 [Aspergillus heteromorphus CBS 117.55]PWY72902.1 hypothetical protein BO70DRAFT_112585 [Aspergillus heteromorphus CBS 117.55]
MGLQLRHARARVVTPGVPNKKVLKRTEGCCDFRDLLWPAWRCCSGSQQEGQASHPAEWGRLGVMIVMLVYMSVYHAG